MTSLRNVLRDAIETAKRNEEDVRLTVEAATEVYDLLAQIDRLKRTLDRRFPPA